MVKMVLVEILILLAENRNFLWLEMQSTVIDGVVKKIY